MPMCSFLADLIVVCHFLIVSFVVGSQILILTGWFTGWHWIRNFPFRLAHLLLVALIAVQSLLGNLCPLTVWEYRLRQCAGQIVESDVFFLARLLRLIMFYDLPSWFFDAIYVAFGVFVILTFFLIPPEKHCFRRIRKDRKDGLRKVV